MPRRPPHSVYRFRGRRQGEPIPVKAGERVLFHVLNASASKIRSLALPGHLFQVVALDGNLVPHPTAVPVLWLGTAERISAIVEMKQPGVWVLGETVDEDRKRGMGVVVEYAGAKGEPQWQTPAVSLGLPTLRQAGYHHRAAGRNHSIGHCRAHRGA
jgi:FtsP/CotA-like multicopper oxidase with cupredoxin domain